MPNVTTVLYVERDDEELEVKVTGFVWSFVAGNRSGHPDTWTPDDGGEVEIDKVTLDGRPFELTPNERAKAEEKLAEEAQREAEESFDEPDDDYDD